MKKSIIISCEEIKNIEVINSQRMDVEFNSVEIDQVLDQIEDNIIIKYLLRYYTGEKLIELINDLI